VIGLGILSLFYFCQSEEISSLLSVNDNFLEMKKMQILKIEKDTIYAFNDFTFMVFDRNSIIQSTKGEVIGYAWAIPYGFDSNLEIQQIESGSNYHNMLSMTLVKCLCNEMEKNKNYPDSPE